MMARMGGRGAAALGIAGGFIAALSCLDHLRAVGPPYFANQVVQRNTSGPSRPAASQHAKRRPMNHCTTNPTEPTFAEYLGAGPGCDRSRESESRLERGGARPAPVNPSESRRSRRGCRSARSRPRRRRRRRRRRRPGRRGRCGSLPRRPIAARAAHGRGRERAPRGRRPRPPGCRQLRRRGAPRCRSAPRTTTGPARSRG